MNPRTSGIWRLLVVGVLAFTAAACQEEIVELPPTPTVTIAPASMTLQVGQQGQFVANVANSSDQAVTWSSSNQAVATVSQTGVATAVGVGVTTIIAAHSSGQQAAASLTVTAAPGSEVIAVTIASVTQGGTTNPVNPNNVSGPIDVTLNVEAPPGSISRVAVFVDATEVCSQDVNPSGSTEGPAAAEQVQTIVCSFDTAELDDQGNPLFPNGPHTLTARLFDAGGAEVASASQTLVFNNPNAVALTVTPTQEAIGGDGLQWVNGDITVTAQPAMFSGGSISRVTFTMTDRNTGAVIDQQTDTDGSDGFSVTFDETDDIGVITSDSVDVSVTTVTSAGQPGPTATSAFFRLDNQAPAITTQPTMPNGASGWLGADDVFADSFRVVATDAGVNANTLQVQTTPDASAASPVWTDRDSPQDIGETTTDFDIRIVVCDALNNCVNSNVLAATGVDLTNPTIQFVSGSVAEGDELQTELGESYRVGFTDPGAVQSGFATTTPVQATVLADTGGVAVCAYGDETVNPGLDADTNCDPTPEDSDIPVPDVEGYQTFTGFVQDQAGNLSTTAMRTLLLDETNPVVDSVTVQTPPLAGGASETFRAWASDNLDLESVSAWLNYTTSGFSISLGSQTVGSYGADVFTKTATPDFTEDFFIAATKIVGGVYETATDASAQATDVVGRTSLTTNSALFGLTAPATDPFAAATAASVSADSSSQTATGSFTITGSAPNSPAARAEFYRVRTGVATFLGVDTDAVTTVDAVANTTTFTYDISAFAATARSTDQVLVIFSTSGGVGLRATGTITP